jgi:hypothetical protein
VDSLYLPLTVIIALSGQPVKLGLVGGSISCGVASGQGAISYLDFFTAATRSLFPGANVSMKNGCVAGTGVALALACTSRSVDDDTDVLFVEYVLNEAYNEGYVLNKAYSEGYVLNEAQRKGCA